jgi:PAS domain S-box-containing protein
VQMSDQGRTSEVRLRAAVESSPSGILMIDGAGKIVLVNREVERLFGYPREELLGQSIEMLVPKRFREKHPSYRNVFFANPKVRSMGAGRELFGLRKNGTEVPVEIGLTPVVTEEGIFVLSSIVDISARKRAEQRFQLAVESSPNGMVMVDSAGQIVLVNKEVERLFGYSREELLGKSIEILVPERSRGDHPSFRQAFHENPQTRTMGAGRELFGLRKDGVQIPVEIGLNPIETEDGLFVLSSVVDISARRQAENEKQQLEDQLRQSQKMEAVGRLAGGIAHDFNNILSAIIGYAEFARDGTTNPEVLADLDEILVGATRGKEIVERILRFSRRQEPVTRPIDLMQATADAVKLLRATLPANVEICIEGASGSSRVLADPTSVHQVVVNLATNAVHAMPTGGKLEIQMKPFYARDNFVRTHPGLREGPYVMLSVVDSGTGMDEDTKARVFEPFFTTKLPGSGSGLGLAMVHGILQELGGTVWIESELGHGTTAKCLFPSAETISTETVESTPQLPRGNGVHILYVDDEPALARLGERRLKGLGYAATSITDPRIAVELFKSNPATFSAVVTDYSMPNMHGLDMAKAITRVRGDIPIVLVTGYMEDLPPADLIASGIRTTLKKPITVDQLAKCLHEVLRAQNPDPPSD